VFGLGLAASVELALNLGEGHDLVEAAIDHAIVQPVQARHHAHGLADGQRADRLSPGGHGQQRTRRQGHGALVGSQQAGGDPQEDPRPIAVHVDHRHCLAGGQGEVQMAQRPGALLDLLPQERRQLPAAATFPQFNHANTDVGHLDEHQNSRRISLVRERMSSSPTKKITRVTAIEIA